MTKNINTIVIFAREPVLGKVKSRLSPALDETERLDLYKQMLTHTAFNVSGVLHCSAHLYSTDQTSHPFLKALSIRFNLNQNVQSQGDLGVKMTSAIQDALLNSDKAILIGSDCPFITSEYLVKALDALDKNDLVIGPAVDGGFVMIGTRDHKLLKPLFKNIEWGTAEVLNTLLKNVRAEGTDLHLVNTLHDIDRPEDLSLLEDFTWSE